MEAQKFRHYLLYASGEILLVMIGILLALQVNNWNERRKDLNREFQIVGELRKELFQNLQLTDSAIYYTNIRLQSLQQLLRYTKKIPERLEFEKFNKLLNEVIGYKDYTPIINKTVKILSLDNFVFNRSDSLGDLLAIYMSSIESAQEYYKYNIDTWKMTNQAYLLEHYPIRNFNWISEDVDWSKHRPDIYKLMGDPVFENVLAMTGADIAGFFSRLQANKEMIIHLIHLIETDYGLMSNN